jgi:phage tail-like protein
MDANHTPYFLLRTPEEFEQGSARLRWDGALGALTLAQNQSLRLPASDAAAALTAWTDSRPLCIDRFNQLARLSADRSSVEFNSGRGFRPLMDAGNVAVAAPAGQFTDMCLNGAGRLALPFTDSGSATHGLVVFHLAHRWRTSCDLSNDFAGNPMPAPRRAWVDDDDQVWVVTAGLLLLCSGEPLPLPYHPQSARFEPQTVNPHDLALRWVQPLPTGLLALALCGDGEQLYLLADDGAGKQSILTRPRSARPDQPFRVHPCADDVPFIIDLALAADSAYPAPGRLAALAPKESGDTGFVKRDAVILELHSDAGTGSHAARLVHERYPMLSQAMPRFVSSADGQLRYQAAEDPDYPGFTPRPRELHALRRPQYHMEGNALLQQVLDAGQPDLHWHRLYLDATIPPGCAIEIGARVFATPEQRGSAPVVPQPPPLLTPLASELGFAASLAPRGPHSGLYDILLQRPEGPVRRLSGRYLQLQLTLRGDGRQTPALHAVRVYAPRFSYQESYLPELYRQERRFDPAAATGPANGADVRERLLAAFEGVLTPIEGRIAAADQLVHPDAAPAEHLPWLAEALGTTLPVHWPEPRRRRLVSQATLIQQFKGTLFAVNLALDIATAGGVQRGEVVVVENFRLRRTMATILGVSMDDSAHPLTLGTGISGNSIVGDSLILSEKDARHFLALFSPGTATTDEKATVEKFFADYAHQVTVLLHGRGARFHQAVEETLAAQMPAHLQWRIFETDHPFVLGTAPLLAVDTFIETEPGFRPVTLDDTSLGGEGILTNPPAFSPADINALMAD